MWRGVRLLMLVVVLACVASPTLGASGFGFWNWYLIPAAASNPGLNQTYWRLDLSVLNPYSWRSITVRMKFLREKVDNTAATYKEFVINAGGQLFLADVVKNQFGVTGKGALVLYTSDGAYFTPNARSYTTSPTGTYGHAVIGQSWTVYGAATAFTAGIRVDSDYRTNIGAVNASSDPISILAEVLDANGAVMGSYTFNLLPWSTEQVGVSSFASNFGTGSVRWTASSSAPYFEWVAYATPVDNTSGDAIYLEEREDDSHLSARPKYALTGRWEGALSIVGFGSEQVTVKISQSGSLVSAYIYNAATGCRESYLYGYEDQGTITFSGTPYLLDFWGNYLWGTAIVTSSTTITGTFSGTGPYANGGSFAVSKVSSSFPASAEESTVQDHHGRPIPGGHPMQP
jgi:hypothetical protein